MPVAHGAEWESEPSSGSACAQAFLISEPQRLGNRRLGVHLTLWECGEGDSNPHVLSDTST